MLDSANKWVYNIVRTKEENKRRTKRSEKVSRNESSMSSPNIPVPKKQGNKA